MKKRKKVQVVVASVSQYDPPHVLLLQTNARRGSFWQNVTGGVEKGEKFHEAALRELWEETGVQPELVVELIPLGVDFRFNDQYKTEVKERGFLAILNLSADTIIKIDPSEHQNSMWKPLHNITRGCYEFASNYAAFIMAKAYLENVGGDDVA